MNDPETFWLNATNIALGVVTLICCIVIARAVMAEYSSRRKASHAHPVDSHSFSVEGLGMTMADGGEAIDKEKK